MRLKKPCNAGAAECCRNARGNSLGGSPGQSNTGSMTTRKRIKVWMTPLLLCLLACAVRFQLHGQPATYSYDAAGNQLAIRSAAAQPPVITSPPASELIQTNGTVTFSVVASGSGLSYQWLSNGVAIPGANSDSLTLANLSLSGTNLGFFSVILSSSSGSITSAPAALWPDINRNGIPDWWELYYFGNLHQPGGADFDGDGVDNLHEYLEGTDPTNPASFNPRLVVESSHGEVSIAPLQPFYTMGQLVTLTAIPDPQHAFNGWSGSISATKPQVTVLMDTNKLILASFGYPLSLALDNTNLLWSTGGGADWFGEVEVSKDGVAAAQSGPIVSYYDGSTFTGQQTWLQTIVESNQPTIVSFWWNVSSRPPDALSFSLDSMTVASISGEAVGWQNFQTNVPPGRHTLTWTYTKGPVDIPTGVGFADSGWVDQVSIVSTNLQTQPPALTISSTATNTVVIAWPASSAGFVLEQSPLLAPANWTTVTNPVDVLAGENQVVVAPSAASQFYRLRN